MGAGRGSTRRARGVASEELDVVAQLKRNAVDVLPEGALEKKLRRATATGKPLRIKLGIDPTAPDVHLGHLVVLRKLREFQDAGHVVVLIIGDFTARIGDPSGRVASRPVLGAEEVDTNAARFQEQAFKVLDPEKTEVRRNSEWLEMPIQELFQILRETTVAQLLERRDFQERLEAGKPLSILETLYPVMQAQDSVAISADVEIGGTDQKFNLLLGRSAQGGGEDAQVVLTMPLLRGLDGVQKMGKSAGNYIGVEEPAAEIYGKTMSIPDELIPEYATLLMGLEREQLPEHPMEAKRVLARGITEMLTSAEDATAAEDRFNQIHSEHNAPEDTPKLEIPPAAVRDGEVHLPALIASARGCSSTEARRLIKEGAIRLDDESVAAEQLNFAPEELKGKMLRVGRRHYYQL